MAFIDLNMCAKSKNFNSENQYDYDSDFLYNKLDELNVIKKEIDFENNSGGYGYDRNLENYMLQNFNIQPKLPSMVPGTKKFVELASSYDYSDDFGKHSAIQNMVCNFFKSRFYIIVGI